MTQDLHLGREAYERNAWRECVTHLAAADVSTPLAIDDLERLAVARYLVGQDETSLDTWTRVHQACLGEQRVARAVRAAFWMVLELLARAEWARAGGWLSRARGLLEAGRQDCPECGLLLVLEARVALKNGDSAAAGEASARASELGERFGDPELRAFALLSTGQALAWEGRAPEAAARFDEAMVAITIGGVSPIAVGTVYCAVIEACHKLMDLRRMREWTEALSSWCHGQQGLVPFRGQCLVHRAEVLSISGAWSDALDEARKACGLPSAAIAAGAAGAAPAPSAARGRHLTAALHQIAEIQRVRGRFAEAEAAYREANAHGRAPGHGFALLRLAQGDPAGATAAIRRALAEPADPRTRSVALSAAVEIELAAGDAGAARRAADELEALAAASRLPWVGALAARAGGTVLLSEGDPRGAIGRLREAWMAWQELEVPYEAARTRVAMGLAHRALGDEDAAALEFDGAERVCERLGAEPELRQIERLRRGARRASPGGLTPREHEILARLATGLTNRAIARELSISERTVDRHVSNILTKLDLPSRSAATAYAYEHGLM